MRRLIAVIALCLLTFPALCQSSKWQIAIVTEVKPRPDAADDVSGPASYEISVKVGDTIYLVLYKQPLGEIPAKYETGRELLVLVGKDTISYNDILGETRQVPIESRRSAKESRNVK